ncbi:MAG: hypothetical protein IKA62_06410 [Clostridia bacterium]|nr:hypothetical protein [Clostridia bacterium]
MLKEKWLNLQLFAGEGAGGAGNAGGEGGGESAATGENAVNPEQQRLLELGVPADKLRNRAQKSSAKTQPSAAKVATATESANKTDGQVAAADTPTEEGKNAKTARMSWEEIMSDPEYNKQMQSTIQSRLKSAKAAEENLNKLTPALELLARKHNLDPANMDYDALAKAINEDRDYYEDKALEMGVPVETAMKIDQDEREKARNKAQAERTLQEQKYAEHFDRLEREGEELKKVFPSFDLRTELKNPVFARMTAPGKGVMSVEDAYHAVHRKEIQAAAMQVTAQKTAQKISNAIQAGSRRPDESGTSSQAPSSLSFSYRNASTQDRNALKKRIRDAAARGEKVYPGQ